MRTLIFLQLGSLFIALIIFIPAIFGSTEPSDWEKIQRFYRSVMERSGCCPPREFQKEKIDKMSCIAAKAAEDAKKASNAQKKLSAQAAHRVKSHLADTAEQASKAAEAALTGKEALVLHLQEELIEAEAVVEKEKCSIAENQANVQSAMHAAQQSQQELKTLKTAIQVAEANAANAQAAAIGIQRACQEKQQLLECAMQRVEELQKQLEAAIADFEATQQAARNAKCSAKEAKNNADRTKLTQFTYD